MTQMKRYQASVTEQVSHGDQTCSMGNTVNNSVTSLVTEGN